MIRAAIIRRVRRMVAAAVVVGGSWILATGVWSDAGVWDDTATWIG